MMLEAAPTPCRRTGFHISSSSEWADAPERVAPAVLVPVDVLHATAAPAAVQVGSIMIKSPGLALSMAAWMLPDAATWVGALPPMVTLIESIDDRPLVAVITN